MWTAVSARPRSTPTSICLVECWWWYVSPVWKEKGRANRSCVLCCALCSRCFCCLCECFTMSCAINCSSRKQQWPTLTVAAHAAQAAMARAEQAVAATPLAAADCAVLPQIDACRGTAVWLLSICSDSVCMWQQHFHRLAPPHSWRNFVTSLLFLGCEQRQSDGGRQRSNNIFDRRVRGWHELRHHRPRGSQPGLTAAATQKQQNLGAATTQGRTYSRQTTDGRRRRKREGDGAMGSRAEQRQAGSRKRENEAEMVG
jgi:hypothetical protein